MLSPSISKVLPSHLSFLVCLVISMEHKAFVRLLLFLGFSYLLLQCCSAVPATRSLKSIKENPSDVVELFAKDAINLMDVHGKQRLGEAEGGYIEGRMDLETTVDYPGTGANNHHDPKTPGRA